MLEGLKHLKPSEFAKFYFDFECLPYQTAALDSTEKNNQLVWGRQTGKSTITAIRGLYDALMNDDWTVLILAPNQRQSNRLFKKIKGFITKSARKYPELKMTDFIDRETMTVIEFTNGSEILSLPIAEDGNNIRGFTAHKVIIDEAADVRKQEAWAAINPMTMSTGGGRWLIGTLKGVNNLFYRIFKSPTEFGFVSYCVPSTSNPYADRKQMELDKLNMSLGMWNQEYLCIPMEELDSFFPSNLVNKIIGDYDQHEAPLPQFQYFLGVDPAGEGIDSTVYAIIMKTASQLHGVKFIETKHQTLPQIEANCRILHQLWNFKKIMVDKTGGRAIDEFLIKDQIPAEGIHFTIKNKEEMYQYLKQQMQAGTLTIYKNDECIKQLLDMRYEPVNVSGTGHLRITSGQSKDKNMPGGDDYPTALALAVWATKIPNQPIIFSTARSLFAKQE